MVQEVLVHVRQVTLHQVSYYIAMFVETGEVGFENVPQLVILDQCHENPKCDLLTAVVQEGCHYKIHALDVSDALIVT